MEAKTNLGTLGRVFEIMKEEGIVDIPETDEAFDVAFSVVLGMSKDKLIELLQIVTNSERTDYTDEEAMNILENFFTNLGENLSKFVKILTRDFQLQKNLAIEKMNKMIEKFTSETLTLTDLESLSKMVGEAMQTN